MAAAGASRWQQVLRSGNAKVALVAAGAFVPVLALQLINGPGGAANAFWQAARPVKDAVGGVIDFLAMRGPSTAGSARDAQPLDPKHANVFEVARLARAQELQQQQAAAAAAAVAAAAGASPQQAGASTDGRT